MASVPPPSKRIALYIAGWTWVLGILLGLWIEHRTEHPAPFYTKDSAPQTDEERQVEHLVQLLRFYYKDPLHIDTLYRSSVDGLLRRLGDPHIAYFSDDPGRILTLWMDALGVRGVVSERGFVVQAVYSASEADGVGLQVGDTIRSINGKTLGSGEEMVFTARDTAYFLELGRNGEQQHLWVDTRGVGFGLAVKKGRAAWNKSVRMFRMLNDSVGVIALRDMEEGAYAACMRAWDSLDRLGMRYLVLDLRGNAGGDVHALVRLANQFVPQRRLPLFGIQSRDGRMRVFYSNGKPFFTLKGLVVLVDAGTSYEAEVFAAILDQYVSPSLVVGTAARETRVVRKGFALPNGDSVLMPIARYVLPFEQLSGRQADAISADNQPFYPTDATKETAKALSLLKKHFKDWWKEYAYPQDMHNGLSMNTSRTRMMRAWHDYLTTQPQWYYRYRLLCRNTDSLLVDSMLYAQVLSKATEEGYGDLIDWIAAHWQEVYSALRKSDGD